MTHAGVQALADRVLRDRGKANPLRRLVREARVPIICVDHERRLLHANGAARLFLRRSRDELARLVLDDLVTERSLRPLYASWRALLRDGTVLGATEMRTPDGIALPVECMGIANALPGQHVIAWIPSHWPADELGLDVEQTRASAPGHLSPREREVLTLLARGASLAEIADELSISTPTAKTHMRNAVRRLGARHRAHAVALGFRAGEISFERG